MIYPARATTREARTLDTSRSRTRTLQPQTEQQTKQQSARIQESSRATSTATATGASGTTPPTPPFRSSLWDAFSGTPARPTIGPTPANSPATGTIPSATTSATPSAAGARVDAATSVGTRNSAPSAAPTSTGTTRTITQNADEAPVNPVPPHTELLTQVRTALNNVGLNPDQYNLRVGSLTISYPNIPTYEYPVLFADINGQTAGFYLNGVAQNPGMFAVNVSSMLGRPVMHPV